MRRGRGSWHRGPDPGIGRRRGAGCSGALEGPDDNHAATATRAWRAMVCCGAGGWVRLVACHRRIGHRHGHGDQFSGTRDILLAGGAGEQPVVTDAVEPLWRDVEEEAPDELVGGERRERASCRPLNTSGFAFFPPLGALHGAVRTLRGFDLPRRPLPVLFLSAIRLTLGQPKRISAARNTLVFSVSMVIPPYFSLS